MYNLGMGGPRTDGGVRAAWGSTDPWLGGEYPVKWSQISEARIIVESSGLENYRIDPSQGTHFFQNATIAPAPSFGYWYK